MTCCNILRKGIVWVIGLGIIAFLGGSTFVQLADATGNVASIKFVKNGTATKYQGETVATGTAINLSWIGQNVEKCKLFEQPVLTKTSKTTKVMVKVKGVEPTSTMPETINRSMDFVLKCKGTSESNQPGREVTDTVRVVASDKTGDNTLGDDTQLMGSRIIGSFRANPIVVKKGGSTTLTWDAPDIDFCELHRQRGNTWEDVQNTWTLAITNMFMASVTEDRGFKIDNITEDATFRLTCYWNNKKMRDVRTITVRVADSDSNVLCTADAKRCPDGSYVGRVAPDCHFAPCPGEGGPYEIGECTGNWCAQRWWELKEYPQFARPIDVYSGRQLTEMTHSAPSVIQLTVGEPDTTSYTWKTAYYTNDGKNFTENITLIGQEDATGQWIVGEANGTIDTSHMTGSTNYIATYTCKWNDGQWRCGCTRKGECGNLWYLSAVARKAESF